MVGCPESAITLARELQSSLQKTNPLPLPAPRPRIYFEEWNDPLISGIGWVSELIDLAGGIDVFFELSSESLAKNRIIADAEEVVRRNPDIIIGSWCGKPFKPKDVESRPGWQEINAVQNERIYELNSSIILQPGPAALTDGFRALEQIVSQWKTQNAFGAGSDVGPIRGQNLR